MPKVAPEPANMSRDELVERFGEMEASDGVHDFVTMKDGWKIHRETWKPSGPAKAVLLFQHGDAESTRTIGVRRFAHSCLKRGIIFVAYDNNGHGESLEKNGALLLPKAFRGQSIEPSGKKSDHMVEIADAVVKEYKLPLIIAGHSGGGVATCCATDKVIAVCKENGVEFVTGLYLSPGLGPGAFPMPCGLPCCRLCILPTCWVCCCCNCCGQPVLAMGTDGENPGGAIGEVNALMYLNLKTFFANAGPWPQGGGHVADAAANMKDLASGLLLYGTKDMSFVVTNAPKLGELVPNLKVEAKEGLTHHYLNMNKIPGDPTSCETIEYIVGFAETKLNELQ